MNTSIIWDPSVLFLSIVAAVMIIIVVIMWRPASRTIKNQSEMKVKLGNANKDEDLMVDSALPLRPYQEVFYAQLLVVLKPVLKAWLENEIHAYAKMPKPRIDLNSFDPRTGLLSFRGQRLLKEGHGIFEQWRDESLTHYRNAVGTINHDIWGRATLLEIWAADHYQSKPDMVREVFYFCYGKRNTLPFVEFSILPILNDAHISRAEAEKIGEVVEHAGERLRAEELELAMKQAAVVETKKSLRGSTAIKEKAKKKAKPVAKKKVVPKKAAKKPTKKVVTKKAVVKKATKKKVRR